MRRTLVGRPAVFAGRPFNMPVQPISRVLYGAPHERDARDGHSSAAPVARRLKQPTRMAGPDRPAARGCAPFLFGLAPGGVCRAVCVAANAVRSYRTVSPLPQKTQRAAAVYFSVALSLGVHPRFRGNGRSPDVIRHRLSVEPGLSSLAPFRALQERPSSRLTPKGWGGNASASRLEQVFIQFDVGPLRPRAPRQARINQRLQRH
jgi:hypothetical protein